MYIYILYGIHAGFREMYSKFLQVVEIEIERPANGQAATFGAGAQFRSQHHSGRRTVDADMAMACYGMLRLCHILVISGDIR